MKKIMTIDDSPSLRQMVVLTLEKMGYEVTEAVDAQDALSKVGAASYDLFLTDLNMPGMDGIELTKRIRALPAYKFVPILLLTTESETEKKIQGKAAGASGWIGKPFRPEDLVATIKKVLRQ